jgi:hypothetical protein
VASGPIRNRTGGQAAVTGDGRHRSRPRPGLRIMSTLTTRTPGRQQDRGDERERRDDGSARTAITNPTPLPPTVRLALLREPRTRCTTEPWSVDSILVVLDVAAPRGRAGARGDVSPSRREVRSRMEPPEASARCLGPSVQRLPGGCDGVVRFLAAAVRVCAVPSQNSCCYRTCLRCGHDGGVRWPAGRVRGRRRRV